MTKNSLTPVVASEARESTSTFWRLFRSSLKRFRRFTLLRILVPFFRIIAGTCFDKSYLRGRHFDASLVGWKWAWRSFWTQKLLGINRHIPWPVSPTSAVDDPAGIIFDLDDMQNFTHFGCYYSNVGGGKIYFGKGTHIAPNVGIITTNHSIQDPDQYAPPRNVIIGQKCWVGMNTVILPGVTLADHTVVAAGSVVTKSFPEGWVVIAGNPARIIRKIEK